ncbi:Alpha-1,2-Mannosidase [Aphelenchoides besseyi]|nr:Alpha-1,2-Mannosidase [Aphelenchoides besseyi]KAI6200428.1 Alpha-1,2-Mannosidase [Aphelenchoides besseyi]
MRTKKNKGIKIIKFLSSKIYERLMNWRLIVFLAILTVVLNGTERSIPPLFQSSDFNARYRPLSRSEVNDARSKALEMFYFGYNNYMKHAYPKDELDPIHCEGRGYDHANRENININDVLGDYSLTLIDALDTLAMIGNVSEFHRAVRLVENVNFNQNVTVQVFEATIRIIGGLLSSHLIITNQNPWLGDFRMADYDGKLLSLSHELATRLLPAFDGSASGLPFPRVNLQSGVQMSAPQINETCTSGAGSLLLEFGILSRLVGDDIFERLARRVNEKKLWERRSKKTGLLGHSIDVQTGEWLSAQSGLGAGFDSFLEILLKGYILFGNERDLDMYIQYDQSIQEHLRRGRAKCRFGNGMPPFYANVDMRDGSIINTWIDALQASYAAVQLLAGELDDAICSHALYYAISPDVNFYPLRPEFVESTYLLFQATKAPFYRHVGIEIINSLNKYCKVNCGYATVHNVLDKTLEDRQESFFLSETCKYLILLFDDENPVNRNYHNLLFSTQAHIFPILSEFHEPLEDIYGSNLSSAQTKQQPLVYGYNESCETPNHEDRLGYTLNEFYMGQYLSAVGVSNF